MLWAAMATGCASSCVAIVPAHSHLSRLPKTVSALCCSLPPSDHQAPSLPPLRLAGLTTTRRLLAGHALFALLAIPSLPALATDEIPDLTGDFSQYTDDDDKYSLLIPSSWVKGAGKATGERLVTAFYPAGDTSVNVNVLITDVGPDFTSMGSFGTIDAFAETLVNSLDRSWKKPPGQAAKLIDSKSNKGLYYIEYTVQQPGEKKRHLFSVVGMRFNGWYNRLYTLTGQYWEEDKAKYGPVFDKVVESFKFV